MKSVMATKIPRGPKLLPGEYCTEFYMHISQFQLSSLKHVRDYSEHRLEKYIEQVVDEQQKFTLKNVLKDYKAGRVAIAWKSGRPVWLKITREKI